MTERTSAAAISTPLDDPRLFGGIFDALPGAAVFTDLEHRIRLGNPAFEQRFGWRLHDVVGRSVHEIFLDRVADGDSGTFVCTCRRADERSFMGRTTVSDVLSGGRLAGFLYHICNVSAEPLSNAPPGGNADAARAQGDFLARISHEIRTPMNGVMGMTELMLDTSLSHAQREYAEAIYDSGASMLKLLDSLLDLSKIESGKLEIETVPFELYRVVGNVVELFAPQADSKGVRIACHVDPALPSETVGDPLRLRQILSNLVSNAVKFTHDGEVIVRVRSVAREADTVDVRTTVSDTGIGIRKEQMDRLFNAFSQADDKTARLYGGTGLGLAISKQLVELMGGSIGVTSTQGSGSTFTFDVRYDVATAASASDDDLEGFTDLPVLLVDSSESIRAIVASYLRMWNAAVYEAADGAEAIRLSTEQSFRVALVHSDLDDMPGLELAEHLRRIRSKDQLKLILLTGFKDRGLSHDLREAGFDACVAQTVWPHRLRSALENALHGGPLPASADAPGTGEIGGRVLLVEDNPVNQRVADALLSRLGYQVEVASDGPSALDALARYTFDVILMDCQLPQMDGFETTRRIRELNGERARVPIIALTANAIKGDRERCIKAGMNDYVTKPFRPETLKETLDRWISACAAA